MSDFLSQIHREQADFVQKYVDDIIREVPQEIKSSMNLLGFPLLIAEVKGNAVATIRGYSDWLASEIFRSNNFAKQGMPICDKKVIDSIARKREVSAGFVKAFISRIIRPGIKLPLIGEINGNGQLVPNKVAIEQWASFFDWS